MKMGTLYVARITFMYHHHNCLRWKDNQGVLLPFS